MNLYERELDLYGQVTAWAIYFNRAIVQRDLDSDELLNGLFRYWVPWHKKVWVMVHSKKDLTYLMLKYA